MIEIPFDASYHIGEDLRERPNDATQMRYALSWLQSQLEAETDSYRHIKLLGLMGSYARILKLLSIAQQHISEAIEQSRIIQDSRLETINRIRLAHIYHWQEHYLESEALFEKAIASCQRSAELSEYLDFAYQHAGKCKYDQRQYEAALSYFEEARSLRIKKADLSLINSTQYAISRTLEVKGLAASS